MNEYFASESATVTNTASTVYQSAIEKGNAFLANFWPEDFVGDNATSPWHSYDDFDPKFTREELREMRSLVIINLNERDRKFQLVVSIESAREQGFTYNE